MSDKSPFDVIACRYDDLVARFGHDPRACDYGRPESQAVKFSVLSEVTPLNGKTILDVGCGFADFARYLEARYPGVRYTGVDISEAMVNSARKLRPDLAIERLNILNEYPGHFDVVTANGIFYLLGADARSLSQQLVTRMYSLSRHAVAFNSLSSWAANPAEGEYYADPCDFVDFCRTLTPWVVMRHDYHARDFSIYLYHRENL